MLNHDYNTWQGTTCYNENQLKKVTDTASDPLYQGAFHFQDGGNVAVEYLYDTNGNMTVDYNKKISKIQYNQLNLTNKLQFTYGHTTSYRYGADGTKRNVTHVTSTTNLLVPMGSIVAVPANQIASTMQTDYCGNLIYENGVLSKILTEEGYITLNGTTPVYHYYLKDYQGNNRVVIDQSGVVEQVNHYYPFGMTYGDGIATSNQPYKYNGKELDRMHGLDWYDYGARLYDPSGVCFLTVDPMAEKYYSISPYVYCLNNPIKYIDPDGMDPIYGKNFWGNTKLIGDDGKEAGNAYLVKGSVKREVKSSTKEGKDYSGSLSESKNVMKVPTGGVMDDVVSSVDATLTSQKENGGSSNTGDANATKWDEGSPANEVKDAEGNVVGAKASMNPFMIGGTQNIPTDASNVEFYWHTHPNTTVGGVSLGYSDPSDADKSFQGTMQSRGFKGNAFVIGTRSNTVTFYNKNKSLITIKYSDFKKIGGK